MEYFYSENIENNLCYFSKEESQHCIKVLRKRQGDFIYVIDGKGSLFHCQITEADSKSCVAQIIETIAEPKDLTYNLTMAVCPTKNKDRFETFVEKATELGIHHLVPIIADNSERKVQKIERLEKILLSATKQSLKAHLATVEEAISFNKFLDRDLNLYSAKFIACCFEPSIPRKAITLALQEAKLLDMSERNILVMIGAEGDFTKEEVEKAISKGFIPIHIGNSRLRTETAGITAVSAIYLHFI